MIVELTANKVCGRQTKLPISQTVKVTWTIGEKDNMKIVTVTSLKVATE
jgi:hypothetical protein